MYLIAIYSSTVLNTHGILIKPAKKLNCDKEGWLPQRHVPSSDSVRPRGPCGIKRARKLIPLEILNGAFVFLRCRLCLKCAEVSALPGFWIFLAGIQAVLAGFQFPNHDSIEYSQIKWTPRGRNMISSIPGFGQARMTFRAASRFCRQPNL